MEVSVKYLRPNPKTGIVEYRRTFPERLLPFVTDEAGRRVTEVKRSLGVREFDPARDGQAYSELNERYLRLAGRAEKVAKRDYDQLDAPLIEYLANNFLHRHLELDEASRWRQPPPDFPFETRRNYEADYEVCREMLEDYDAEGLVEYWRDWAVSYTQALGYTFDTSTKAFAALCRALGEASCQLWLALNKRIDGISVATPEAPTAPHREPERRPAEQPSTEPVRIPAGQERSFREIALELIEKRRADFNEPTKERVRGALRFLDEAVGSLTPAELTRERVTVYLDLLAERPAKLPKADFHCRLTELSAKYEHRPEVPRLAPKTIEAYCLALNARWKEAQRDGTISMDLASPFSDRKFSRKGSGSKAAKGFSPDELKAYFAMPAFKDHQRPVRGKGEAIYWIPLLMMFTGARPEEVAQLLVADIFQHERDGRWVIRFTDEGTHPVKGKQSLKTEGVQSGRRTFPIPQPLLDLGLIDYRQHLLDAGELALFPLLRRKGKRSGIYASFGEWMCDNVYDHGVLERGRGRQPVREFRHTWTTAARASRIPREAMEYIQGHRPPDGGSAHEGYGERDDLGNWIDDLQFKVDVVTLVPKWKPQMQ